MSTEPFIGEIKLLGFYFAPIGYMTCQGQILSIAQNTALFSLIGTSFGGNGVTTFALPDLQGRVPNGQGQGPGLPNYIIGQKAGTPTTTLTTNSLPMHVHPAIGISVNMPISTIAEGSDPQGMYLGTAPSDLYGPAAPGKIMGPASVSGTTSIAGGSQPFPIEQPYLTINYSIAVEGIFPSRN